MATFPLVNDESNDEESDWLRQYILQYHSNPRTDQQISLSASFLEDEANLDYEAGCVAEDTEEYIDPDPQEHHELVYGPWLDDIVDQ